MNQISRLPTSSVCYYFSFRQCDKSFICSRCLSPHQFWALDQLYYSTHQSALLKHTLKTPKKVVPYKKRLRETELLKVTNKQATEKTMTVSKLNATLVTAFAKEPGMILYNTRDSKHNRESRKEQAFSGVLQEKQSCDDVRGSSGFNDVNKSPLRKNERYSEVIEDPNNCYKFFVKDYHTPTYFSLSAVKSSNNSATLPINSSHTLEMYLNPIKFQKLREDRLCDNKISEEFETEQPFSEKMGDISPSSSSSDLHTILHAKNFALDDSDNCNQLLSAFVDVCVNNGMLDIAHELLQRDRTKNVYSSFIYDMVLTGYSDKGDWNQVQKILRLMEIRRIPPSRKTFIVSLDCLYRSSTTESYKKRMAKEILTVLQSRGYKIEDLFHSTSMNRSRRENILQIVHWFNPDFETSPPSFSFQGDSPLVADLYDKDYVVTTPLPSLRPDTMATAVDEQIDLETKSYCEVESVIKRGICSPEYRENWLQLVELWKSNLHSNFRRYYSALKEEVKGKSHTPNLYPFLNSLPVEDFVNLMLYEINHICLSSESFSLNTSILYRKMGRRIWQRYCIRKKIKNKELLERYKYLMNMYSRWYLHPSKSGECHRWKWLKMTWDNPDIVNSEERSIPWPETVKTKIGKFIFDIILKSAVIPSGLLYSKVEKKAVPAFYLVLRSYKGVLSEQLKFHPYVGMLYRRANLNTLFFDVDQLPMLCPPKPWVSVDSGGFYISPTCILRPTQFSYNIKTLRSMRVRRLYTIFDSLNQLQSIPWIVNERVLDVALEVFKEGGSKELNVPTYPDMGPLPEPRGTLDINAKVAAYKERLKIIQQRQDDFGLWCEGLYKLSIANHIRKKIFWLPHNMDFRGRVYPISPYISHITSDLYRSLFLFAKKECLGENGLDWLKIHAINLTGTFSKRPMSERLKHANDVLDDILDSAEKPLDGRRWWTKSEEPWQTLAVCFEIWSALNSEDPKNYKTGFPVHQDGSCNGLQHYAALGRDSIGAASVNLKPDIVPQDVYTVVANVVDEIRKKDAQAGLEIASVLQGFVTRKIVKQTVMTTVYGVTLYGAKLQIINRLKENSDFPSERINEAASYLTFKVFEALKEMFTSAKEIQDWFLKCATIITGSYGASVSWVTPLGLPVIQPYFKDITSSQAIHSKLVPDKKKQRNAFPPNFIHSLDSSHMMLTALYCGKAGVFFASVHDCFWTHPSKVDIMNKICREKFIALHSEEILSDLSDYFLKTYRNPISGTVYSEFMEVPKRGDFDLNSVINSIYFFS